MSFFPAALENLIDKFAMLPGIGKKSAQRLAFFTLSLPDAEAEAFAAAISDAKRSVRCWLKAKVWSSSTLPGRFSTEGQSWQTAW